MFFEVWSLRTLFEAAWTIVPTLFLGLNFGIAYNDKDNQAKEERSKGGVGEDEHNYMTISKKLIIHMTGKRL
jgi:hypothetical protein